MKKWIDYIWVAVWTMIFNGNNEVLIMHRSEKCTNESNMRSFPWGWVDFGETCEDAIIREVKEELDIDIEVVEFLTLVNHIIPSEWQHRVSAAYITKHIWWKPKNMEPEKCDEWKWIEMKDIDVSTLTLASVANYDAYIQKYWS